MKKKHKDCVFKSVVISSLTFCLCNCSHHDYVACYGLPTVDHSPYVIMDKGLCNKLAGGKPKPLPPQAKIPTVNDNDYVMCYGVAAGGQNDCGTKTTACSGSISTPRDPNAWVAALKGVCTKIGGKVGKIKKDQTDL